MKLAVLMVLVLSGIRTLADESTDRLDDFSDISLDDNEHTSSADLSHLSDDEFLSGGGAGGAGGAVGRPGELPGSVAARDKGALMLRLVGGALKKPGMDQRFGQILPILRVMSPPQRLALTALVMQQAMVPKDDPEPALEMAVKLGATPDGSSNLTSQLLLPLSADIAHIFRGAGLEPGPAAQGRSNQLYRTQAPYHPQLQMPRWRGPQRGSAPGPAPAMPPPLHGPRLPAPDGPQRRYTDTDRLPPPGVNRRNAHVSPRLDMIPPPLPGLAKPTTLRPVDSGDLQGCSLFSDTVCASVEHYPEEAILASIHADKHTVNALLADKVPPAAAEVARTNAMQRRQDDDYPSGHEDQQALVDNQDVGEDGQLCAAIIKFARPQRARATSGQWKYIVNTAEHTQTLRLEKCMRVEESCSFLSDKVRSHCSQVYNYHRLLTWDKELGLHMDIFKVPTCCSCRIQKSPFLPSNSVARRPGVGGGGGGGPQFTPHQPYPPLQQAEYSNNQETVVFSESGRPVHPQYRPYGQAHDSSVGDATSRDPVSRTSSKPTWPFRKAATRRPPLQATQQKQYGLQTLEENGAPGELLPPYPPLPLENEYEYPPLAGRRTGSARNRTREQVPDDLTAEGSQRHPVPVILSPEGEVIRDGVRDKTRDGVRDSGRPSPSKRPLIVSLPPRLETYRPRTTTPASTTTPLPPLVLPTTTAAPGGTPAPKRVNYNYHPIIDFFRPLEKQMSAQEPRSGRRPPPPEQVAEQRAVPDSAGPSWSAQQSDWSPITSSVSP